MSIYARVSPTFPARILGENGIDVGTTGGIATVSFDPSQFPVSADPIGESQTVLVYDPVSGDTERAEASSLFGLNVPIFASKAQAASATIAASIKSLRTQFYNPTYTTPATMGGGANYSRISKVDLDALILKGMPAAAYFRSQDRAMPDGSSHDTNGGYWLLSEPKTYPEMFGAVGSISLADDTTAIQASIDYAQIMVSTGVPYAALAFRPRWYKANGLEISRSLAIEGNSARLYSPNGSTSPVITIVGAHEGTNFASNGDLWPEVDIQDLSIMGQSKSDADGLGVVHGIYLDNDATNPIYTRVYLRNVRINGVAGDGITATPGWDGLVESHGSVIRYTGRHGVNGNSIADWRWFGGEISGATEDNVLLAGSGEMIFSGVNIYVAGEKNINVFGVTHAVFMGCRVDLAGEENIYVNLRDEGVLDLVGNKIRWASQSNDATYSDLTVPNGAEGRLRMVGNTFTDKDANPFSAPNDKNPQFNVNIVSGSTTLVEEIGNTFLAGDMSTTGVCNNTANLLKHSVGAGNLAAAGSTYKDLAVTLTGGETARFINVASAVNRFEMLGSASGSALTLKAAGSDTNINISWQAKGTGTQEFTSNGGRQAMVGNGGDGTSYVRADGGTASTPPTLFALGTPTDIDLRLSPKGAGRIRTGYATAAASTPGNFTADRVLEFKDSTGTLYYLPCRASTW